MARPHDSERYDSSDAEKRDLVKLIEQAKPLPEKYRFPAVPAASVRQQKGTSQ